MTIRVLLAALGLAFAVPFPALAANGHQEHGSGHYEWRQAPQAGPRATGPSPKRVWVPAHAQTASCDCDGMKMSADDCMNGMQHVGETSHG